ncbi:MAG: PHP domain-containing protein [Gammaproteobacteria bacterium]|nr:PHP domain-containing protein [Gammaproteobacteria bacterium]
MALALTLPALHALAHGSVSAEGDNAARTISFPDTAAHHTVIVDLHTHSVFSDGHVWPNVRVAEAQRDGLDGIAITEHLEWQPHRAHLPHPDRNAAFREAAAAALGIDLLVINGTEITRDPPAGHMNAIFVTDANALVGVVEEDAGLDPGAYYEAAATWPAREAVLAANDQGAFVFWNHAWWSRRSPNEPVVMTDLHADLAYLGKLHGIEIANGQVYSEAAHRLALAQDLTMIGTSDVHNLIDWDYEPHRGGHRPVTLVLAEERSQDGVKAALFAGRTVVLFRHLLIGRGQHLQPLLEAGLTLDNAARDARRGVVSVTLRNHTSSPFRLRSAPGTDQTFAMHADLVDIAPHSTEQLRVTSDVPGPTLTLEFEVLSALTAPGTHPRLTLSHALRPVASD